MVLAISNSFLTNGFKPIGKQLNTTGLANKPMVGATIYYRAFLWPTSMRMNSKQISGFSSYSSRIQLLCLPVEIRKNTNK